jgi:hypothetical protein
MMRISGMPRVEVHVVRAVIAGWMRSRLRRRLYRFANDSQRLKTVALPFQTGEKNKPSLSCFERSTRRIPPSRNS